MGTGIHGGFGNTRGRRSLYFGTTKAAALKSILSLPTKIQKGAKSFFKGSSTHYNRFSVEVISNGDVLVKMENPGKVPGSKAIYYKIMDPNGRTVRVYKETYDPSGNLVHRKEK